MTAVPWDLWLEPVSPVADLVRLARAAERRGAARVWLADEGTDRDLVVALTAILLSTDRIVVGSGITNPWSRHPVTTAAAFASLEELRPGRVILGLGVGGGRVLGPLAVDAPRPYTALRETLSITDRLLAGERVSSDGEVRVNDAVLPWATGRLPLAVAGRGPRVQALGATRASWVLLSGKPLAEVESAVRAIRLAGASAGNRPLVAWSAYLAPTPAIADAIRRHFTYATVDMPRETRAALGVDEATVDAIRIAMARDGIEAAGALVPPAVVARAALVGTPDAVVAGLRRVRRDAAPDAFVLPLHDHTDGVAFIEHAADLLAAAGFGNPPPDAPPARPFAASSTGVR